MIEEWSGFSKRPAGAGSDGIGRIGRLNAKWQMGSKQKRQKRQAQSKSFAGSDAAFLIRPIVIVGDRARGREAAPGVRMGNIEL